MIIICLVTVNDYIPLEPVCGTAVLARVRVLRL